jgi:hypothetical protein
MITSVVLILALQQEPTEVPPPESPAPAPVSAPVAPPVVPSVSKPKGLDEITRVQKTLPALSDEDRRAALEKLKIQFGDSSSNSALPPNSFELSKYVELPERDQVKLIVRYFFQAMGNADNSQLISVCGLPFFLEDKRVEKSDDLKMDWNRSLRGKRTDLGTLYGIDVFTRAEMETKFGKPPARLSRWDLKAPKAFFAVANVSGFAHVVMLKSVGLTWQVVGFHD